MKKLFLFIFSAIALLSCTNDAYETGDSRYSYLRTDFVDMYTGSDGKITMAVRDADGIMMALDPTPNISWISVPDSNYRALLYYKMTKEDANRTVWPTVAAPAMTVEPLSVGRVYVLDPKPYSDTLTVSTDPVHFQSSWLSTGNNQYANLSLALMTGVADSVDARQSIGLVCDSVIPNFKGSHTYYYRLSHNQGGVPEYYKSTIYISIPTKKMTTGDIIRLSINTYDGVIVREFTL